MAYITLNGKLVKVNKSFTTDPNVQLVADAISNAKGGNVVLKTVALQPNIVLDTDTHYQATYSDSFGTYDFQIHKTDQGYTVISDGNVCSKNNPDREYIVWNYETQVAAHMPRVLA